MNGICRQENSKFVQLQSIFQILNKSSHCVELQPVFQILDRSSRGVVREALSPAAAECLRAVFAAFMWHEGIVHDAMACASFLKFHPDLTKEMSKFVKV